MIQFVETSVIWRLAMLRLSWLKVRNLIGPALCGLAIWAFSGGTSLADNTDFTFSITNNTSTDLKFDVNNDQNKNLKIVKTIDASKNVSPVVIKAGDSKDIILQPEDTSKKCSKACNSCYSVKGRLKAYYDDDDGNYQMNNYYKVGIEFSQYCGNNGVTSFTSDWDFEHHQGDGDNYYNHKQSNKKTGSYTGNSGHTYDGSKYSASITVVYTDP